MFTSANRNSVDVVSVSNDARRFCGGVPTSLHHSGQQWDFPNGWAPLQHLVVVGLEKTGVARARQLAFDLAQKWIVNNFDVYRETRPSAMFEKYDVTVDTLPGGGGEYDVQLGFGWTNGVAMELLAMYGDRLAAGDPAADPCAAGNFSVLDRTANSI